MAYDSAGGAIVLFGGTGERSILNDTWLWDGSTWTEHHSAAPPPPRQRPAMTYDPVNREVVLFGGATIYASDVTQLADTWTWSP